MPSTDPATAAASIFGDLRQRERIAEAFDRTMLSRTRFHEALVEIGLCTDTAVATALSEICIASRGCEVTRDGSGKIQLATKAGSLLLLLLHFRALEKLGDELGGAVPLADVLPPRKLHWTAPLGALWQPVRTQSQMQMRLTEPTTAPARLQDPAFVMAQLRGYDDVPDPRNSLFYGTFVREFGGLDDGVACTAGHPPAVQAQDDEQVASMQGGVPFLDDSDYGGLTAEHLFGDGDSGSIAGDSYNDDVVDDAPDDDHANGDGDAEADDDEDASLTGSEPCVSAGSTGFDSPPADELRSSAAPSFTGSDGFSSVECDSESGSGAATDESLSCASTQQLDQTDEGYLTLPRERTALQSVVACAPANSSAVGLATLVAVQKTEFELAVAIAAASDLSRAGRFRDLRRIESFAAEFRHSKDVTARGSAAAAAAAVDRATEQVVAAEDARLTRLAEEIVAEAAAYFEPARLAAGLAWELRFPTWLIEPAIDHFAGYLSVGEIEAQMEAAVARDHPRLNDYPASVRADVMQVHGSVPFPLMEELLDHVHRLYAPHLPPPPKGRGLSVTQKIPVVPNCAGWLPSTVDELYIHNACFYARKRAAYKRFYGIDAPAGYTPL